MIVKELKSIVNGLDENSEIVVVSYGEGTFVKLGVKSIQINKEDPKDGLGLLLCIKVAEDLTKPQENIK